MKNKALLIALLIITAPIFAAVLIFSLVVIVMYFVVEDVPGEMTNDDFGIASYVSNVDMDGDGIDDQTDILNSVRDYIATNPKYKSKYYDTGYPNDEYGVCTDVVAFGLKGAGYDLMQLVNEDIVANGDLYGIDKADINIDFRRVRNLKIYFERHAIKLTTDKNKIEEWQGVIL